MTGQPVLDFAGLLRQLRGRAGLTQEELAEAAGLSLRAVSDLERGIHRTARKDTALLLADALGMAGPVRELFVAAARGRAPAADVLAAGSGPAGVAGSPYRGLKAFQEQDEQFFFGREAATAQVLQRTADLVDGAGLLVVSGVSGAGKSSLLRAGVLPRIRRRGLAGAAEAASWPSLVCTPTHAPLDELALRAGMLSGADAAAVRRGLKADPAGFALTARQAALTQSREPATGGNASVPRDQPQQRGRRLLLLVDQFEQLFTLCADEQQRQAFSTALHAAATVRHGADQEPAALVVLCVRADFEARCADYPWLADAVQDRYLVRPMNERQLRMAITEPAKRAGSPIEENLVEVLLADVRTSQPGAFGAGMLPLLSHALDQAWRNRTGNTVTLADYERTGCIEGAVADSAQRTYDALSPAQQVAARQVFTRLAAVSSDGMDTADRATRADLTAGKSTAEAQDVEQVLEAFAAERLLTLSPGTVELGHEVLLTAWPLLRDKWLADTHADRIVRTRLQHTATEWASHARDPAYLYTGTLLHTAVGTAARITADPARHPPLGQAERDFLRASDRAYRRVARRRNVVVAGLLVLTLTAVTAAGIAARNAATAARNTASARRQHAIALSRQLAAESLNIDATDPVTARRLAVAAWRVSPTSQAGSAMTTLLGEQQQSGILLTSPPGGSSPTGVDGVAFSPNGKLLASADSDGTIRLWDAPVTGQPGRLLHATTGRYAGVLSVAFSPNSQILASADADGTVRLWKSATGQPVRVLHASPPGLYPSVVEVAFSPDGRLLASVGPYGTVRLWNLATGQSVHVMHMPTNNGVDSSVAFSPDGRLLASSSGATIQLWNPASGQPVRVMHVPAAKSGIGGVDGLAFSPHGRLLASADGDGTIRLWDPATGQPVRTLYTPAATLANGGVIAVAFSPDGRLLASADGDKSIRLWDPATGHALGVLLRIPASDVPFFTGGLAGVAFSPDGQWLAVAVADGTVRLLDLATGQPLGASLNVPSINAVAFSANGRLLASGGSNGAVQLRDLTTDRTVYTVRAANGLNGVDAVAFSPNGRLLASGQSDGTTKLWDTVTGQLTHILRAGGEPNQTGGVAFSPDGRLLATADGDGTIRLWDPVTGQLIRILHVPGAADSLLGVAFSPNGQLLAVGDLNGTVRLWDPVTGQLVRIWHVSGSNGADAAAFSPDGRLLATPYGNGTVTLWNPATGHLARVLPAGGKPNQTGGAAFSPNGRLLASTDGRTVQLWNAATGQALGVPFGLINAGNGVIAAVFSPNGQLLATADTDGTVRFWKVSAFVNPYATLCADAGAPTRQEWEQYAAGEPQPSVCT